MAIPDNPRPYFLPEGFDLTSMPSGFVAAFEALVQPAYVELVLEAPTAMERAAGASFVFLLFLEVLDQFDIGAMKPLGDEAEAEARHRKMAKCLRIIGAKERWGKFMQQLVRNRRRDPLRDVQRHEFPLAS